LSGIPRSSRPPLAAALALGAALFCSADPPHQAAPPQAEPARGPSGSARIEEEMREGRLEARRIYDAAGALSEESFYGPEGLAETRSYIRSRGRLERIEARDPAGLLVGEMAYRYDGSGRLIGLACSGSFGQGKAGMLASGPAPSATWVAESPKLSIQLLDEAARPLRIEELAEGKASSRREYSYGEGPFPQRSREEELGSGLLVLSDFDQAGRILRRVESRGGADELRVEYRYDEAGRLVEERSRGGLGLVLRLLSYGESGELVRAETRIGGVVSESVAYEGETKIVESYHEGELFVRASYAGGRKLREEFFEEGVPVRSKEYR